MLKNSDLQTAYNFHRRELFARNARKPGQAVAALSLAREDMAAGKKRYCSGGIATKPYSAVTWQPANPRYRERLGYVDRPQNAGLRHVGDVVAECGGRNGYFNSSGRGGWFTDPFGDVFKDGTGLCWGVVYQLPARDGKARFVAGYQFGGTDQGPTLDFGTIFESDSMRGDYCEPVEHCDARDAARSADSMAQNAAEKEREYQTAYAAGSRYAEKAEEVKEARKDLLEILAERRKVKGESSYPALCRAIKSRVTELVGDIERARKAMRKLAAGDYQSLIFYPGEEDLKAAFCDGAGLSSYPG